LLFFGRFFFCEFVDFFIFRDFLFLFDLERNCRFYVFFIDFLVFWVKNKPRDRFFHIKCIKLVFLGENCKETVIFILKMVTNARI
jgi:hypothetical protein